MHAAEKPSASAGIEYIEIKNKWDERWQCHISHIGGFFWIKGVTLHSIFYSRANISERLFIYLTCPTEFNEIRKWRLLCDTIINFFFSLCNFKLYNKISLTFSEHIRDSIMWEILFLSNAQTTQIVGNKYVRYLRSGFEYFWNRFASILVPTKPMMVPDRSRRALSISLLIFLRRPASPALRSWRKPQNTV